MLMEKPHVFLLVKQLNLLALRRHMALFHLLELKSEGGKKTNWAYARKMDPVLSNFCLSPLGYYLVIFN